MKKKNIAIIYRSHDQYVGLARAWWVCQFGQYKRLFTVKVHNISSSTKIFHTHRGIWLLHKRRALHHWREDRLACRYLSHITCTCGGVRGIPTAVGLYLFRSVSITEPYRPKSYYMSGISHKLNMFCACFMLALSLRMALWIIICNVQHLLVVLLWLIVRVSVFPCRL